jgi:hypothetical protein
VPGWHYERTCNEWLRRMDAHKAEVVALLEGVYGPGTGLGKAAGTGIGVQIRRHALTSCWPATSPCASNMGLKRPGASPGERQEFAGYVQSQKIQQARSRAWKHGLAADSRTGLTVFTAGLPTLTFLKLTLWQGAAAGRASRSESALRPEGQGGKYARTAYRGRQRDSAEH